MPLVQLIKLRIFHIGGRLFSDGRADCNGISSKVSKDTASDRGEGSKSKVYTVRERRLVTILQ